MKHKRNRLEWLNDNEEMRWYFNDERRISGIDQNYATYNSKTKLLMMEYGNNVDYYPDGKLTKQTLKTKMYRYFNAKRTMVECNVGNMRNGKQCYTINIYAILNDIPSNEQMLTLENLMKKPVPNERYEGMTLNEVKKDIAQQQRYAIKRKIAENERWEKHLMNYCTVSAQI